MGETRPLPRRARPLEFFTRRDVDMPLIEERYYRHLAQLKRWRAAYNHLQAVEAALRAVGKIDYAPVDYEALREPVPWEETPLPSGDHILADAVAAVNARFVPRLWLHGGLLAALVLMGFLWPSAAVLWFTFTGALVTIFSGYQTWRTRYQCMVLAMDQAYVAMEEQRQAELRRREAARLDHERTERERVAALEKFLAGDGQATLTMLAAALRKEALPFMVRVTIDVYAQTPCFSVLLPERGVIPPQRGVLLPSGRLLYEAKSPLTVSKEYARLCAALLLRVAALAYATVPFFDAVYVQGWKRDAGRGDACVLAARFSRETFVPAVAGADDSLAVFTKAGGVAPLDAAMTFTGVTPERPAEWRDAAARDLRSLVLEIGQGAAAGKG